MVGLEDGTECVIELVYGAVFPSSGPEIQEVSFRAVPGPRIHIDVDIVAEDA